LEGASELFNQGQKKDEEAQAAELDRAYSGSSMKSNKAHRHSGIGLVTPEQLHYGMAEEIVKRSQRVLYAAFKDKTNRFKGKMPQPPTLPVAAWINKPSSDDPGV
jgi:hypothetical protein